jgi:hypothetical protein
LVGRGDRERGIFMLLPVKFLDNSVIPLLLDIVPYSPSFLETEMQNSGLFTTYLYMYIIIIINISI